MFLPAITVARAQRFHDVQNAVRRAAMTQMQEQAGNPHGIALEQFGHATAFRTAGIREIDAFNRIIGMQVDDLPLFHAMLEFFDAYQLPCYVDLGAWHLTPEIGRVLVQEEFVPVICDVVLYGKPQVSGEAIPAGIEIRIVHAADLELFSTLWADGFDIPEGPQRDIFKALRGAHFAVPGNRLYLALVNGTPVAIAALYIHDRIGYLNVGATLPAFRGRGCHTALTARRIADAAQADCEFVIGLVSPFGGISQQHLQRAGLQLAYNTLTLARRARH